MENVRTNPVKALPNLMSALGQPTDKGQEEGTKQDVPKVFELLPKALSSLSLKDKKAVVAACVVITRCVKLANDPAVGTGTPPVDASIIKQCVSQLSALLQKAQSQGTKTYREDFQEDEDCSVVAESVAVAMKALFQLEEHGRACRQQFVCFKPAGSNPEGMQVCGEQFGWIGGLQFASESVRYDSGMTADARKAIVTMFLALVETPEGATAFIQNGCIYPILPYCVDATKYGIPRDFQMVCMGLLRSLLKSGQYIENRSEVEAALEKAKNRKNSICG